ncbi:hypothetical protein [Halorubrum ezzemoulense]|uniref:hypothetical protein n=1 Tax=Halorubrum ezzemoulense TaxID=337243 RepID=UPI002330CBDD|nr:hypothetical protein [Halorubrum ezzemoulense]MDB2237579.1 hypothetical protein [Halorubrum ezzemoulense]MDB2248927.1 hypothetical protein [Halorubrum ezzemoulense]
MSAGTGECRKCKSEIREEAERCPECGYEPGPGILGGIVMWVSAMLASVFVTIALTSLIIIGTGFPIIDGLTVFVFTGSIGAGLLGIVYVGYKSSKQGPTGSPDGTSVQDRIESWDGEEAGEAAAKRINSIGPALIAALPTWTWTAGVIIGVVLHLSLWLATVEESEIGMGVSLIGGITVSVFAIVADTRQVKWTTDYSPRSWFWAILGAIPLFGWIFGVMWLLRKRQKAGSFVG